MPISKDFLAEMEQEAAATRRLFAVIPDDKLDWAPHPKSMTLGQLALHVARIPGGVSTMATANDFEIKGFKQNAANSRQEILDAFEESLAQAKANLDAIDDACAAQTWTAHAGGKQILALPRAAMLRTLMLNHNYHHRGQLTVYLRLLDVPLPSVYGPSADTPI